MNSDGGNGDVVDDEDVVAVGEGSNVADDVGPVAPRNRVNIVGSGRTGRAVSAVVDRSCAGARVDGGRILGRVGSRKGSQVEVFKQDGGVQVVLCLVERIGG